MEAAGDVRVDKSGTMCLGKVGDNVGAISRKPGFGREVGVGYAFL